MRCPCIKSSVLPRNRPPAADSPPLGRASGPPAATSARLRLPRPVPGPVSGCRQVPACRFGPPEPVIQPAEAIGGQSPPGARRCRRVRDEVAGSGGSRRRRFRRARMPFAAFRFPLRAGGGFVVGCAEARRRHGPAGPPGRAKLACSSSVSYAPAFPKMRSHLNHPTARLLQRSTCGKNFGPSQSSGDRDLPSVSEAEGRSGSAGPYPSQSMSWSGVIAGAPPSDWLSPDRSGLLANACRGVRFAPCAIRWAVFPKSRPSRSTSGRLRSSGTEGGSALYTVARATTAVRPTPVITPCEAPVWRQSWMRRPGSPATSRTPTQADNSASSDCTIHGLADPRKRADRFGGRQLQHLRTRSTCTGPPSWSLFLET